MVTLLKIVMQCSMVPWKTILKVRSVTRYGFQRVVENDGINAKMLMEVGSLVIPVVV